MIKILFVTKEIWKGRSITRAYLNLRLQQETLRGKVIDVGGGKDSSYLPVMNKADDVVFKTFDMKSGNTEINFEKDALPAVDSEYDTVLFLNVMEHIFNYQHIANEVVRITKSEGKLIGFVPFLMWYHPDHSDYFRYTHESLKIIFERAGATNVSIEPIAQGPFTAAAQMKMLSLPKILRVFVFATSFALDSFYKYMGRNADRYALGYYFVISK